MTLWAIVDKAEALVKKATRALVRDKELAKRTERELLPVLADLKERAGALRHPVAHGVHIGSGGAGPIAGIAEQGLWEHLAFLGMWVDPSYSLTAFGDPDDVERHWRERAKISVAIVETVDQSIAKLDQTADWGALQSSARQR